jgi:hypothetical protein
VSIISGCAADRSVRRRQQCPLGGADTRRGQHGPRAAEGLEHIRAPRTIRGGRTAEMERMRDGRVVGRDFIPRLGGHLAGAHRRRLSRGRTPSEGTRNGSHPATFVSACGDHRAAAAGGIVAAFLLPEYEAYTGK